MNKEYDLYLPWDQSRAQGVFNRISEETIFRLNPHWILNGFSSSAESFRADVTDHESEQSYTITGRYRFDEGGCPEISGDDPCWQSIQFFCKGGTLQALVCYRSEPEEKDERQVVLWLRSVKEYLRLCTQRTLYTRLFRLLMDRVILQMTPSQRKISLMLVRITILELLVILVILVGWFLFLK